MSFSGAITPADDDSGTAAKMDVYVVSVLKLPPGVNYHGMNYARSSNCYTRNGTPDYSDNYTINLGTVLAVV